MWAVLYGSLAGARLGLAWRYATIAPTAAAKPTPTVTVVQPILSGDPALVACLARNLENQPDARFLWLVDDNDAAGRAIAASLAQQLGRAAVTVVVGPPPCDGENPKMAKLMRAEAEVTSDVLLVLDDDTVLPPGGAAALAKLAQAGDIATGLPVTLRTQRSRSGSSPASSMARRSPSISRWRRSAPIAPSTAWPTPWARTAWPRWEVFPPPAMR
jgi:ceramide glucosyltransferase